jgi:hypothetical protein
VAIPALDSQLLATEVLVRGLQTDAGVVERIKSKFPFT